MFMHKAPGVISATIQRNEILTTGQIVDKTSVSDPDSCRIDKRFNHDCKPVYIHKLQLLLTLTEYQEKKSFVFDFLACYCTGKGKNSLRTLPLSQDQRLRVRLTMSRAVTKLLWKRVRFRLILCKSSYGVHVLHEHGGIIFLGLKHVDYLVNFFDGRFQLNL